MAKLLQARQIAVLGGGYAGVMAAVALARKAPGARITLINARPTFVERIRLHQLAAGQALPERPIADLLEGTGVELLVGAILGVDLDARQALVEADGSLRRLPFDRALVALGSRGATSAVPGAAEHGFDLGSLEGASALAARLEALPDGSSVVICGGGLTGVEAAAELAEQLPRLRLRLISDGPIAAGLSARGRSHVLEVLARLGVTVDEGARVVEVSPGKVRIVRSGAPSPGEPAELVDETPFELPCGAFVWAAGLAPSSLGREAGLAVNGRGQILVDAALRSISHPWVYAAGDCAALEGPAAHLRMACATALPMGLHAARAIADDLAGRPAPPFSLGYAAQCVSLGRERGLIQRVALDDTPRDLILTGRLAAIVKEGICLGTTASFRLERRLPGLYRWPAAPRPLVPRLGQLPQRPLLSQRPRCPAQLAETSDASLP
jgi:NADH:ubiquinone reductase (H+-translocating)